MEKDDITEFMRTKPFIFSMKTPDTAFKGRRSFKFPAVFITLLMLTLVLETKVMGQEKNQMVRLAKIKVDPLQLEKYNAALKHT